MATFYEAFKIKKQIWRMMLRRPEINGIGVGFANPKNPSKGAAIIVYYNKNSSSSSLFSLLSSVKISSVPVRLIPTGRFRQDVAGPKQIPIIPAQRSRWRPVPGGVSIGRIDGGTGTAGVIVTKNSRLFILSNNHVLVKNNSTELTPILQPGRLDGGRNPTDRIGVLSEFVPLAGFSRMDAAIAISRALNPRYVANVAGRLIVVPGHLVSYRVGENVWKSGRTTEISTGVVEAIGVNARADTPIGPVTFVGQTVIRASKPTAPGDSGSVWLKNGGDFANYAVAVHHGSTNDPTPRSVGFPIDRAMRVFGVSIAVPAGSNGFKAGAVKGFPPKNNFSYVRPLTKAQLARIRVLKAKFK